MKKIIEKKKLQEKKYDQKKKNSQYIGNGFFHKEFDLAESFRDERNPKHKRNLDFKFRRERS